MELGVWFLIHNNYSMHPTPTIHLHRNNSSASQIEKRDIHLVAFGEHFTNKWFLKPEPWKDSTVHAVLLRLAIWFKYAQNDTKDNVPGQALPRIILTAIYWRSQAGYTGHINRHGAHHPSMLTHHPTEPSSRSSILRPPGHPTTHHSISYQVLCLYASFCDPRHAP